MDANFEKNHGSPDLRGPLTYVAIQSTMLFIRAYSRPFAVQNSGPSLCRNRPDFPAWCPAPLLLPSPLVPRKTLFASLLALASASLSVAPAVELRVAAFNIGAHYTGSNPEWSLGDPGTVDYESVKAILARIDADVVSLEEIDGADVDVGNPSDLRTMATALGYPYILNPPVSGSQPAYSAPLDNNLRVCFLSRYPFAATGFITSPSGAREMTRFLPWVKVDVPGTLNDPTLIAAHLKSSDATEDRFRRAIELKRMGNFLSSSTLTQDDNYIIMGDFNMVGANRTFTTLPTTLPSTYSLGSDVSFPVTYTGNPVVYLTAPGVTRLDPRQLSGSAVTYPSSGNVLDLMMVSPALAGRNHATEVYNSALDTSNSSGLVKAGNPLPASTSTDASDHFALIGDFELDEDLPNLQLTLSLPTVLEGMPDGVVTATVTLPAVQPNAVNVMLSSDDPGAADVMQPVLQIPAGSLSGTVGIRTPRNFLADPQRSVTISALALGHDPDSAVLVVEDRDGPYVLHGLNDTVTENFNGFDGSHDPAPWATSGGITWRGADNGASTTAGLRAYGASAAESSLGFLPDGTGTVASASFTNGSSQTLTAVQIAYDVEQWRAAQGGRADTLTATLFYDGSSTPLPALDYTASTALPTGAVSGGSTTARSATVSGLAIPPGASFELRFAFTPGPAVVVPPSDIFINEFHYDNTGTDSGEFIELAVGTGFSGQLSDIDVVLYNGDTASAGVPYGSVLDLENPAEFTLGGTSNGYKFYVAQLPSNGIQNGPRDGFAVVNTATNQVLQFISYEGAFTATNGPATGLTSLNIPVSQNGTEVAGESALGLTGTGIHAADFTWQKISGPYSAGQPNNGQTFSSPAPPSQGIAIDNLSVTMSGASSADHDGDGIADSLDPDDDNDTQSDADEIAFGTNPLDAASVFRPTFSRVSPTGFELHFPGAAGITYTVQSSTDLEHWSTVNTYPGAGAEIVVPFPQVEGNFFVRVKAGN